IGDGSRHEGCYCVTSPTSVPGVAGAVAIATGMEFGAALLADGSVRAWGANGYGQLGNGNRNTDSSCGCLTAQTAPGVPAAKSIAAGERQMIALLPSGVGYSWGNNYNGELGRGERTGESCGCIPLPGPDPGIVAREFSAGSG